MQSSVNIGDGSVLEEMCETLILAIVMILWKGITDSDDAAWTVCYSSNLMFSIIFYLGSWSNIFGTSSSSS
jgi:hypothetical protein